MIQRIQSVWLLIIAVLAFLSFKLPFYNGTLASSNQGYKLTAAHSLPISIITVAIAAIALVTIFLYKTRVRQLWLCIFGILIQLLLLFFYYQKTTLFTPGTGSYTITSLIQVINIALFLLAAKAINKDEKMVKDSDRLR